MTRARLAIEPCDCTAHLAAGRFASVDQVEDASTRVPERRCRRTVVLLAVRGDRRRLKEKISI